MKPRQLQQKRGWAWAASVAVVKPTLMATTTHEWYDGMKIPPTGGCLVVLNHISHVDPLTAARFVYDYGRLPRYLAKSGLFKNRFFGFFMASAGQIPVDRESDKAMGAYDAACRSVEAGECVVVYPEGTITRDPDLWPMRAKSGAARIALETGCPVIPIGQWGAQHLLAPYSVVPHLIGRKHIVMKVGDPVDLSDLVTGPHDVEAVGVATGRMMDALTGLVADIRGEVPPAQRYDMRTLGDRQTGNPDGPGRRPRTQRQRREGA